MNPFHTFKMAMAACTLAVAVSHSTAHAAPPASLAEARARMAREGATAWQNPRVNSAQGTWSYGGQRYEYGSQKRSEERHIIDPNTPRYPDTNRPSTLPRRNFNGYPDAF